MRQKAIQVTDPGNSKREKRTKDSIKYTVYGSAFFPLHQKGFSRKRLSPEDGVTQEIVFTVKFLEWKVMLPQLSVQGRERISLSIWYCPSFRQKEREGERGREREQALHRFLAWTVDFFAFIEKSQQRSKLIRSFPFQDWEKLEELRW